MRGNRRCILFDLGSTLWERKDQAALQASEQAANEVALAIVRSLPHSKKLFASAKDELGSLLRETIERRIRKKKRQDREHEPDFALITMEALQELGLEEADRDTGEAIFEALRVRIPAIRVLFEDTLTTLTVLKERGYLLGVVTNRDYGGQPFYEDLSQMGLLDYIDYATMAISADLGVRKPHADIFMHALNALHVTPEEAAMVGDSLRADIVGAKKLHLLAIWKPKATLRARARAAYAASSEQLAHEPGYKEDAVQSTIDAQHLQDLEEPSNEYVLSYALQRLEPLTPAQRSVLIPDAIIRNLSDLLSLFP
jgi:HAD superfamily hydrolase (TIGR01549 family)